MVVFTLPQTNTNYCTSAELWEKHHPIHLSLHHRKQYCPQPRVLTLRHLELLTSGRPLYPFRLRYCTARKKNRKRREERGLGVGNKCFVRTCAWLLQDGVLNLSATSGRGWAGAGCIKEPRCPNALE